MKRSVKSVLFSEESIFGQDVAIRVDNLGRFSARVGHRSFEARTLDEMVKQLRGALKVAVRIPVIVLSVHDHDGPAELIDAEIVASTGPQVHRVLYRYGPKKGKSVYGESRWSSIVFPAMPAKKAAALLAAHNAAVSANAAYVTKFKSLALNVTAALINEMARKRVDKK